MRPKTAKRLIAAAIIAVVFAVAIILRRPSAPKYDITDLGPLSKFGYVSAFNNKGQVAGETETSNGQRCAFFWDPEGGKKLIRAPDRRGSTAYDINDKGQVVGELFFTGGKRSAFVWDKETGLTELGTLDGISSVPAAINNSGQVTGWIEDSAGKTHAFIWDKTNGMKGLGTLGGPESIARDINDKGQVVGISHIATWQLRAFIWDQANGMVHLDGFESVPCADAQAINNSGQVVGAIIENDRDCGFIWQKSKGVERIELSGHTASPMKINATGQVLGFRETGEFMSSGKKRVYFLWDPEHGSIKLTAPHWRSSFEPHDINNRGQIIGIQMKPGPDHVVILTPESESRQGDK